MISLFAFSIIDWNASSTYEMIDWAGKLIDDLNSPLVAIVGVGLGLIVFEVIISVIRWH